MFDYLELQAFAPGDIVDLYGTSSPGCTPEERDQDLSAFFPELMEADWQQQQQRCSQCRWKLMLCSTLPANTSLCLFCVCFLA